MSHPHCLITGGSSGIGLACARRFVERGYNISLMARRQDVLEQARTQLLALRVSPKQKVLCLSADVGKQSEVEQALASAVADLGPPSIVMSSAGVVQPGTVQDLPVSTFEQAMQINYLGTVYLIKALLPYIDQRACHIVMVASGAGLIGLFGYSSYSPSKFALRGLAESLHAELRHTAIRLSIVYPPDTDTPQLHQENLSKPPETRMMTEAAGIWSADAVAGKILQGIDAGKFAITPGLELTLLYRLGALLTPLLQWLWAIKVRRLRRRVLS
jgi:3-dehydrosphinganine reductase